MRKTTGLSSSLTHIAHLQCCYMKFLPFGVLQFRDFYCFYNISYTSPNKHFSDEKQQFFEQLQLA